MSGGVDSSVCAYLLKKQGFEFYGVTMEIYTPEADSFVSEKSCCGSSAVEDARTVSESLGITHYAMDYRSEFEERVIRPFSREYLRGRTPNPCIMCNRSVKWGVFYERCREMGADYIATGHYARRIKLPSGRFTVANSLSEKEDQTDVLYGIDQEALSHTLFPIGEYEKPRIREIAAEAGLLVATKKDSQDICFIPDGDYASFIKDHEGSLGTPGSFIGPDGKGLGPHRGTAAYTIGQRKGLSFSYGERIYVTGIDTSSGNVYLGSDSSLFSDTLTAEDICYMGEERLSEDECYRAKIRYSQSPVECHVRYLSDEGLEVIFDQPVRAAAPCRDHFRWES